MRKLAIILLFPFLMATSAGVTTSGVSFNSEGGGVDVTKSIFNGKCPICEEANQKSIVEVESCHSTLLAGSSYYDEDGVYHYNDPNTTTCSYRCSNGHTF